MTRVVGTCVVATLALMVALVLAGGERGLALYAYVLFLGVVALRLLTRPLRSVPRTRPLDELVPPPPERHQGVQQLDSLARQLSGGQVSTFDLHARVRPLVTQIASAMLARHHGVDFERSPGHAQALLGPRTWELVRPEREPPEERFLRGWTMPELEELIEELEGI